MVEPFAILTVLMAQELLVGRTYLLELENTKRDIYFLFLVDVYTAVLGLKSEEITIFSPQTSSIADLLAGSGA